MISERDNTAEAISQVITAQLLVFSVTPFKIDQNKNQNHSIDQVQNLKKERG